MITAGQKLYEERIRRGLTLEEIARATKIRSSFLSAIEKGEYKKLPSSAYIQGFVKNYAEFLGLPQKEIVALFKREFNEREFLSVLPQGFSKDQDVSLTGIRFGQTAFAIIAIFVTLLGYILFQYRYAFINPPLEIDTPKEGEMVSVPFFVSGKTDPNATVFINEDSIVVDADGNFKKNITLFPGKTIIKITAQNRLGKKTQIDRHVEIKSEP